MPPETLQTAVTPEEYQFLDMRYEKPVRYRGQIFPSAENAYQSARFADPSISRAFRYMAPKTAAYQAAVRKNQRPDWREQKERVLFDVLSAKFSDPYLRKYLKQTGSARIVLTNLNHENDLGVCRCPRCRLRGRNLAGSVLERIRDAI